jgi:hypothetical protein
MVVCRRSCCNVTLGRVGAGGITKVNVRVVPARK